MSSGSVAFVIFLVLVLGAVGYIFYQQMPGKPEPLVPVNNQILPPVEFHGKGGQFYPNMRFSDKKITYEIRGCPENKESQMIRAFEEIESVTILEFSSSSSGVIEITCPGTRPENTQEGNLVAGEARPTGIINGTKYSVIGGGTISLYREETCTQPHVAMHELLHVLGFDHNDNAGSIMYPTLNCNQHIDDYIIDTINELYSVPSMPDLSIPFINATKSGGLLDFHIEVLNEGLAVAENVTIYINADGKPAGSSNVGEIDIGTRKILKGNYFKIPRSAQKIEFVVKDVKENDLDNQNNKIELTLNN